MPTHLNSPFPLAKLCIAVSMICTANLAYANDSASNKTADGVETIEVKGFARDYIANEGQNSAVGLDLSLLETPAAISVITQDLLMDQQVNNVDDALRNVAGVTKFKTGNGGEEKFSIRGFDASQSLYKDGARINNALNVSNIPSTETANIERIEVLKGPSALLYGQGEPGGIINYITKQPAFIESGSIEIIGGSDSFIKAEFDYTNAIADSETFAFRILGAYETADSFRDVEERDRLLLNPTLLYQASEDLKVVLGYEFIDDDYTNTRGQALELLNPTTAPSEHTYEYTDRIQNDMFFGVPNWNNQTVASAKRAYALAEYFINDNWSISANYSNTKSEKDNHDSSPGPLIAGSDIVNIRPRFSVGEGESEHLKLQSISEFTDGFEFDHQLLVSANWESRFSESIGYRNDRNVSFNVVTREYSSELAAEDASNPNFFDLGPNLGFAMTPRAPRVNDDVEEYGINILDYVSFNDQWSLLLGGRYSEYDDVLGDRSDNDFSVRTGVVFQPQEHQSIYVSYSEGYTPSTGLLGIDDRTVDPETSVSYELGFKQAMFDEQLIVTATVYHVELNDVPYIVNPFDENGNETLPDDIRYDNLGGVESQGLELELAGQLTDNWRVQGGYAYVDNAITTPGEGMWGSIYEAGNVFPGISEHSFNLFSFYEIAFAGGELGLGGGLFYSGDVFISTENRNKYDGWTSIELAAYYKKDNWKAQINVRNTGDADYRLAQYGTTTDSFAAVRVGTAAPRTIFASIAYEF